MVHNCDVCGADFDNKVDTSSCPTVWFRVDANNPTDYIGKYDYEDPDGTRWIEYPCVCGACVKKYKVAKSDNGEYEMGVQPPINV